MPQDWVEHIEVIVSPECFQFWQEWPQSGGMFLLGDITINLRGKDQHSWGVTGRRRRTVIRLDLVMHTRVDMLDTSFEHMSQIAMQALRTQ